VVPNTAFTSPKSPFWSSPGTRGTSITQHLGHGSRPAVSPNAMGVRNAFSRPGGAGPLCYPSDVTGIEIVNIGTRRRRAFGMIYELQAFPWSGRAPCALASASDI
jgi:hypothetical protein